MRTSNDIDKIYLAICKDLLRAPIVGNTRELNNVKLQLTDIENSVISIRDISPTYLFAELLWYFAGRQDTKFIGTFANMWNKISDDGKTANSAYGHIMQSRHRFNQIKKIIELLKQDPNSRRALININVPNRHVIETKDEPCTIAVQFLIRDGKLHCTTMMRSNDIWFGLPYDVAFFTELQKYIADELEVGYGTYTHFVTSLHMYDRDEEKIAKIVDDPIRKPIIYDRQKFHEHREFIIQLIDVSIKNKVDAKKMLLSLLSNFEIYKES